MTYGHLQADCLYTGISSGPNARYRYGKPLPFYGGRPHSRPHCARWWAQPPLLQKGAQPPPIFGPCLLLPNGWMDQDATLYDGRPRPGQHCVRYGPISTPRGAAPLQNFGDVRCGQTTRWIKMPPGTKVGLGPGHTVLHGDPAPPPKRGTAPIFLLTSIVAERSPISATSEQLLKYSYALCRAMF